MPEKASDELSDDEAEAVAGGGATTACNLVDVLVYCDGAAHKTEHRFRHPFGFPKNILRCRKCGMCIDESVDGNYLIEHAWMVEED